MVPSQARAIPPLVRASAGDLRGYLRAGATWYVPR
jgi:hypothetical protein